MKDIYRPLYLLETPIITTTNETAELIKYAANTMLALKISFINEVANLCDIVGADVYQVSMALGKDKRIGSKFLHPGPGFGGSCFPKDVKALVRQSQAVGYEFKLAEAVVKVNARQKEMVVEKSRKVLGSFEGKTVCLLGLAFKPNTDDVREAPAIYVAGKLLAEGVTVHAFDPAAMDEAKKVIDGIKYFKNSHEACQDADLVIICTEWHEFRDLDLAKIKEIMRTANLYDTRNVYDPKEVREAGFTYLSTGNSHGRGCGNKA